MGMLVTLFLISANVYNSVEAPIHRGFSYIEVWMLGTQFPILLALCEYGLILYWKKMSKKCRKVFTLVQSKCHVLAAATSASPSEFSFII